MSKRLKTCDLCHKPFDPDHPGAVKVVRKAKKKKHLRYCNQKCFVVGASSHCQTLKLHQVVFHEQIEGGKKRIKKVAPMK